MIPCNFLNRSFDLRIPTKDFRSNIQQIPVETLEINTNGWKMYERVGFGIFIKDSNIKLSYRLYGGHHF